MKASRCPVCTHLLDDATAVSKATARPKCGDFSVCAYCGELLCFNADITVRSLVDEDYKSIPATTLGLLRRTQKFVRTTRRMVQ